MRVIISALRFFPGRTYGAEVYFSSLLQGLNNEIQAADDIAVTGSPELCNWVGDIAPNIAQIPQNTPISTIASMLYEWLMIHHIAKKWNADIVFFPFNTMPPIRIKSVLMLHDLVSYFYADNFPNYASTHNRILRWLIKHSVSNADAIIVPSHAIAAEIARIFPHQTKKTIAIHEAATVRQIDTGTTEQLNINKQHLLLQTGAKLPHKSQHTGIEAIAFIKKHDPTLAQQIVLAITGGSATEIESLQAQVVTLGIEDNIQLLGKVSDSLLESLSNQATLHLFPTLYEGFGLGIVEAQKIGKAILASRIPVLEEVSSGIGEFFEPGNASELGIKIIELLGNSERLNYLETEGRAWAQKWNWNNHARALLDEMKRTMQE